MERSEVLRERIARRMFIACFGSYHEAHGKSSGELWDTGRADSVSVAEIYEEADAVLAVLAADQEARRVNPEPLAALKQEAEHWAEFFVPFIEDDNDWYRHGQIDAKDAGELGEFAQSVLNLIAKVERVNAALAPTDAGTKEDGDDAVPSAK